MSLTSLLLASQLLRESYVINVGLVLYVVQCPQLLLGPWEEMCWSWLLQCTVCILMVPGVLLPRENWLPVSLLHPKHNHQSSQVDPLRGGGEVTMPTFIRTISPPIHHKKALTLFFQQFGNQGLA